MESDIILLLLAIELYQLPILFSMPEFRQKKSAEQMENSSPNPSFSICDIRIQKRLAECFAKSFPQKIVLAKLSPHCSATCPNTWRAEPRKKNTLSFFKRNFTPAKSEMQGVFFLSGLLAYSPVRGAFSERTILVRATTRSARATSFVLKIGASLVQ